MSELRIPKNGRQHLEAPADDSDDVPAASRRYYGPGSDEPRGTGGGPPGKIE